MNWDFLLGLIAGEGCFGIRLQHKTQYKYNVHAYPYFGVCMHDRDDGALTRFQQETALGTISERRDGRVQWRVQNADDCDDLADTIKENVSEDHPFKSTNKWKQFNGWCDIVEQLDDINNKEQIKDIIHQSKDLNGADNGLSAEEWCSRVDEKT